MSKAESRAIEKYPAEIYQELGLKCADKNTYKRQYFIEGYHQAEKDLIDRAVEWIGEIYNHHEIMRYSDSCEPPLSELTEWFKNYMEEENINSK